MKPSVLDGGHEIILTNWPNTKYVICSDNHNFPIKIPSHLYVLLKGTVLCNCNREVEDNFLLEYIATCPGKQSALTMYYTVNIAFMHYFDSLTDNLDTHISENWTTQEQVFPISLQTFEFDSKLMKVPNTLQDLVYQYNQKGQILNKINNKTTKHSFFDNIIMDIFLFLYLAAILSMIATIEIIHLVCRHTKLKALLIGIAFQLVKQTGAIFGNGKDQKNFAMHWYTIAV